MIGPRGLYASVLALLIGGAAIGSFTRDPDWTLPSEAKAPANAGKADTGSRSPAGTSGVVANPAAVGQPVDTAAANKVSTDTRDRTSRAGVDVVETTGSIGSGASPVKPVSPNAAGLLGGAPAERTGTSRSIGNAAVAVNPAETRDRVAVEAEDEPKPRLGTKAPLPLSRKAAVEAEGEPKPRLGTKAPAPLSRKAAVEVEDEPTPRAETKAERARAKTKQVRQQDPVSTFAARRRAERIARFRAGPDSRAALMASDASVWRSPFLPSSSCRLETRWAWTPAGDQPMLVRVCR
ncbi:MAG: hypothetical protein M3145_12835 [Pseudomonadota bacterium]|nr:hypothetical protein [Pseudomonadota bacterium]